MKSKSTSCTEYQPTKPFSYKKTIKIAINDQTSLEITLPEHSVTCKWLLNEVINKLPVTEQKIVALKTISGNETMDYYLTLDQR